MNSKPHRVRTDTEQKALRLYLLDRCCYSSESDTLHQKLKSSEIFKDVFLNGCIMFELCDLVSLG